MNPDAQFMQTYLGGKYDSTTKTWSYGRTQGNTPSGLLDIITKRYGFQGRKSKANCNY